MWILNIVFSNDTATTEIYTLSPHDAPPIYITPGTATRLAFTQQPTNTVAGGAISPAVQLSALDPAGNLVPTFTGSVTVGRAHNWSASTVKARTPASA